MSHSNGKRAIHLDGCLNFRDLGGYPTEDGRTMRWGQVFRSDAIHLLTANDVGRIRDELRIRDIIDLRSSPEVKADGRGPLAMEAIRFHHVPLFDGEAKRGNLRQVPEELGDQYFLMAEFAAEPIAAVIATLANTDGPALYHCAAGKDRTGVVSAVLLGILGVKEEIIVADYALSQENLEAIIARLMASDGYQVMFSQLPPSTRHARPETMTTFLSHVKAKYSSIRGYARNAGVSNETLRRLQARLLI